MKADGVEVFPTVGDRHYAESTRALAALKINPMKVLIDVKSDTFSIASTGVIGTIAVTVRAVLKRDRKKNRVTILYWRVEG